MGRCCVSCGGGAGVASSDEKEEENRKALFAFRAEIILRTCLQMSSLYALLPLQKHSQAKDWFYHRQKLITTPGFIFGAWKSVKMDWKSIL